jgi:uncharacterized protein YbbC (DUF1343 family)
MAGCLKTYLLLACITGFITDACTADPPVRQSAVKTGCEQISEYIELVKGIPVGLVANHTTVIGKTHLADSLLMLGIDLVRIFSPEHGFRGDADAGASIGNTTDNKTGIPVVSLYGKRKKPAPEDLEGINLVIYDIQDVGVRFYTYISTLHYVMEACAENHIKLLLLDRPNPLGYYTDGPVLQPEFRSFVGMHPIPVVYGMTAAELAMMINGEGWLEKGMKCDLTVIRCKNYDHNTRYVLPVNPSPNLNCMEAVYLYPSVCFFEGTVMSVGRGTDFPFRVIGHPAYPDKSFSFMPNASDGNQNPLLNNQLCYGIDLRSIGADSLYRRNKIDLQCLIETYRKMNMDGAFFTDYIDRLAGTGELRNQIMAGWDEAKIRNTWRTGLVNFNLLRRKYLLYKDFSPHTDN